MKNDPGTDQTSSTGSAAPPAVLSPFRSMDNRNHCQQRRQDKHGDHCSCRILSMAVTGRPDTVKYSYCRNVLQRRWLMTCNHGDTIIKLIKPLTYEPVVLSNGSVKVVSRSSSPDKLTKRLQPENEVMHEG